MYQLIGLDLDGTLLTSDKQISPRTFAAIQAAKAKGVKIVLASGRPLDGMRPYLEQLSLTTDQDYVAYFNGSIVENVATGEILRQQILDGKTAKMVADLAIQFQTNTHAFSPQLGLITPKNSKYTQIESTINQLTINEMDFSQLDDAHPMIKAMIVDEPEKLQEVLDHLPVSMHSQYTIVRSADYFLEFLHPESHKGAGIAAIADHFGIPATEVICFGDAENDHHMIEYAGLGVAMANAMPQTKAIADYITDTNNADGVAQVIEKFVLEV